MWTAMGAGATLVTALANLPGPERRAVPVTYTILPAAGRSCGSGAGSHQPLPRLRIRDNTTPRPRGWRSSYSGPWRGTDKMFLSFVVSFLVLFFFGGKGEGDWRAPPRQLDGRGQEMGKSCGGSLIAALERRRDVIQDITHASRAACDTDHLGAESLALTDEESERMWKDAGKAVGGRPCQTALLGRESYPPRP